MYRSSSENWQVAVGFDIPRDTSRLMVDVLLSCDGHGFYGQVPARTVYSPAAGTGGILLVAKRAMEDLNPKIGVSVYSRELMAWPRQIRPHRLLLMAFLFFEQPQPGVPWRVDIGEDGNYRPQGAEEPYMAYVLSLFSSVAL